MPIDRREDAGDFYQGGKVISTRPVATGGDVKHSDFAGLGVKTNTIPDLREAVRELGRRLGATVVTALAACVAVAATVQTVPINDLDFDANPSMVTNVTFEGLAQEGELESIRVEIASNRVAIASNSVVLAGKAERSDTVLSERGFTEWSIAHTPLSAEAKRMFYDQSAAAAVNDYAVTIRGDNLYVGDYNAAATSLSSDGLSRAFTFGAPAAFTVWGPSGTTVATRERLPGYVLGSQTDKPLAAEAEAEALRTEVAGKVPTSRTINGKALTSNISLSASEVGAMTPADVTAAIREQSLGGIWDETLQVWWTPRMRNGSLTYEATTNVNLNAEN